MLEVAAFLLEYVFYLVPGFERLREWLTDRVPPRLLALAFAISALAPYLLYSLTTGQFRMVAAARLLDWYKKVPVLFEASQAEPKAEPEPEPAQA